MSLLERTTVHADSFPIESFSPLYARIGAGPNAAADFRVPHRTSCVVRRLLTGMYVLNRLRPSPQMIWPVKAPEHIAVVELRGERICFRMRNLAFFEQGLQFSTIVNAQITQAAIHNASVAVEYPAMSRIHGIVASVRIGTSWM